MKIQFRKTYVVILVVVLVLAFVPTILNAQSVGPKVIKPDSITYGKTYGEWSAAWEQWVDSIPLSNHPLFDRGDCSVGQSGPVWFLGGKFCANNDSSCGFTNIVRTCTIPQGKTLYIGVVTSEDSTLEDPTNTQIAGLRAYTAEMIDLATDVKLTVDGAAVPDLKERHRVLSPAFSFTLPQDNFLSVLYPQAFEAGTYFPAVDDGVYVMLSPLTRGQHVIRLSAAFPVWDFSFDVTYNLTVQ